ncbi:tetratricopeptide repeat protein [Limnoglobus roseus]|uniref:Tetratricopeptide repeat protein n=1 Tax=Limnoglobus roseus TaxID=2598579 RepID=A0A5C1ALY6_9BACT|nr:tetratricopeptide repeat protein [Limnoglobus roseus]QEL19585.1 hypothetical protein PX52LOC_06661 [Limnoglobus roseus]
MNLHQLSLNALDLSDQNDRPHDLLARVSVCLDRGKPDEALSLLAGPGTPWIQNARAVCQMRTGRPAEAAGILRRLVFEPSGLAMKQEVPAVFQANYATALLLEGNTDGFFSVFHAIRERGDPAVARIDAALRRWKRSMNAWQRIGSFFGTGGPSFTIDFTPGDLGSADQ